MSKLKVVGKDTEVNGVERKLEIYYCIPGGECQIDEYTGDYNLSKSEGGTTTVTYSNRKNGRVERITVTYNYGEDHKIIETITT